MHRKRTLMLSLVLALATGVFAVPGVQLASGTTERLANGDFESGRAGMIRSHGFSLDNGDMHTITW